jgi:ATP-dependent Clp protease ATP-binding subunit ClpA
MVKTTVVFKDELYKRLVKEAVDRYGTSRTLSRLINEKLEASISTKLSSKDEAREIERRLDVVRRSAGSWKISESGKEYTRKIRKGWGKRLERMDL